MAARSRSGGASGSAGGVLSGTYPNPSFATDMATQAELDAAISGLSATYQPVDSDLTAIAALTTTSFGRALLALADAAALRTAAGLGTAATHPSTDFETAGAAAAAQAASQPVDSDLTAIAALTTTSYGRAFLALADAAAGRTALGLGSLATQSGTFSGTSSGTNTGDQTSVTGNAGTATALQTARTIDGQSFDGTGNVTVIAPGTHAATGKTTPVDADELPLVDSAASNVLKKVTWANLKATLKTYFDTLYGTTVATDTIYDAKGDVAVGTGADTAAKLTVGTNVVDRLIADSTTATGLKWVKRVYVKAGDETVNNSVTLQDDDHFSFAIAANEKWYLTARLIMTATGTTPDFKCGWTFPSGLTMFWGSVGSNNTVGVGWSAVGVATTAPTMLTEASTLSVGSANATFGVQFEAIIINGSTAGTLQFQWAMDALNASNLVEKANSLMLVERLA